MVETARCLNCGAEYKPDCNEPPEYYPYCPMCNAKEVTELSRLRNLRISIDDKRYECPPGRRHGNKTRNKRKKAAEKIKRQNGFRDTNEKRGYYENSIGSLVYFNTNSNF